LSHFTVGGVESFSVLLCLSSCSFGCFRRLSRETGLFLLLDGLGGGLCGLVFPLFGLDGESAREAEVSGLVGSRRACDGQ